MKNQLLFALNFILILVGSTASSAEIPIEDRYSNYAHTIKKDSSEVPYKLDESSLKSKAEEALKFVNLKNMNTDFYILIDMKIHSGRNRFFIWDFKEENILHQFLVRHGCCDNTWSGDYSKENPTFSNVENSHCSSLGKYKIGARGSNSWGVKTKYLLHALDATNSNAMKRIIVFHSWDVVSDEEIYPAGTPEGWGCPTLSNNSFKIVDEKLKNVTKPVLMWIYND